MASSEKQLKDGIRLLAGAVFVSGRLERGSKLSGQRSFCPVSRRMEEHALDLDIVMENDNKLMRAKVSGDIDAEQRKTLKNSLEANILKYQPDVIIDCENLDYIDSTGLGVLVSALNHVKEYDGSIRIINLKPFLVKIFRITGLNDIFEIEEQ